MKIRADFVTNSSSSSFIVTINIKLKEGRVINFYGEGSEDSEIYINKSPEELGRSSNIETLIKQLKKSVRVRNEEGDEISISRHYFDWGFSEFLSELENIETIDDIESLEFIGEYDENEAYKSTYKYELDTGVYSEIEGEDFECDGSNGGGFDF